MNLLHTHTHTYLHVRERSVDDRQVSLYANGLTKRLFFGSVVFCVGWQTTSECFISMFDKHTRFRSTSTPTQIFQDQCHVIYCEVDTRDKQLLLLSSARHGLSDVCAQQRRRRRHYSLVPDMHTQHTPLTIASASATCSSQRRRRGITARRLPIALRHAARSVHQRARAT